MYAVITGASSGIGREFARLLAARGYDLFLTARRLERLQELQKELSVYAVTVRLFTADLSVQESVFALHEQCKALPVEVVINNAGFGKAGAFSSIPLEQELEMLRTNVTAVHILTKLFADSMQQGYILNVASMAAFQPNPYLAAYGATKAYVLELSRAVGYECKRAGRHIHIATLTPGPVNTEFNRVAGARFALASMEAPRCARLALNALFRGKSLIVPGVLMKLLHVATRLCPTRLILPVQSHIQQSKVHRP